MTSLDVIPTLQSDEFLSLASASPQLFISYLAPTAYQHKAEPSLKSLFFFLSSDGTLTHRYWFLAPPVI